jgi:two-component system alkaline phosphatase synthesis response regulator PhoP
VLLVDDDPDVLDALGAALLMNAVAVHTAISGLEAVQAVAQGLRPCVVLLDIRMPNIDGWDAWERMRRLPGMANVPVVMFSGEPPDYRRGAGADVRAYLRKPITHELLVATVQHYCRLSAR